MAALGGVPWAASYSLLLNSDPTPGQKHPPPTFLSCQRGSLPLPPLCWPRPPPQPQPSWSLGTGKNEKMKKRARQPKTPNEACAVWVLKYGLVSTTRACELRERKEERQPWGQQRGKVWQREPWLPSHHLLTAVYRVSAGYVFYLFVLLFILFSSRKTSGARLPGFKLWFHHLLPMWP